MLEVSIIIVSYNSAADIALCFAALERSTYLHFRISICENAGEAAYEALSKALPRQLATGQKIGALLAPRNLGYAGGINFVLDHTSPADAYWILNPDCEPSPDALGAMVARLEQGDCGAVGHDLVLPNGELASRGGGRWGLWTARADSLDHGHNPAAWVDPAKTEARMNYVVGASMLVSQRFLDRVGRMREDYFLYCEEVEWCLRASRMGERIGYAPAALAVHGHGTSTGGGGALRHRSKLAVYLNERNRILVTRDLFKRRLALVALIALVHLGLRYARASAWRQLGYGLSGWMAGLRDERGWPGWWSKA